MAHIPTIAMFKMFVIHILNECIRLTSDREAKLPIHVSILKYTCAETMYLFYSFLVYVNSHYLYTMQN